MDLGILTPIMRDDEHFTQKHHAFLEIARSEAIDVLFLGDSITRRWEDNIELWNEYFSDHRAFNFGVGGDQVQNLKWRILNGEINGIDPRIIVLLIGTNNLPTNEIEEIVTAIADIVSILENKMPNARILLLGLLPRADDEKKKNYGKMVGKINSRLKRAYRRSSISFIDAGKALFKNGRKVKNDCFEDGLHLNKRGYMELGPFLKKKIEGIYGE